MTRIRYLPRALARTRKVTPSAPANRHICRPLLLQQPTAEGSRNVRSNCVLILMTLRAVGRRTGNLCNQRMLHAPHRSLLTALDAGEPSCHATFQRVHSDAVLRCSGTG